MGNFAWVLGEMADQYQVILHTKGLGNARAGNRWTPPGKESIFPYFLVLLLLAIIVVISFS